LRKATLRFVMSVRPRGTTGLPLDEFFLNFWWLCIFRNLSINFKFN
jgi:hypothetical protein